MHTSGIHCSWSQAQQASFWWYTGVNICDLTVRIIWSLLAYTFRRFLPVATSTWSEWEGWRDTVSFCIRCWKLGFVRGTTRDTDQSLSSEGPRYLWSILLAIMSSCLLKTVSFCWHAQCDAFWENGSQNYWGFQGPCTNGYIYGWNRTNWAVRTDLRGLHPVLTVAQLFHPSRSWLR